ncbi:AAA family ATPase [Sorangium cellulosum]|nr:AAA family ATPase [Sorangium cellulosum]
MDDRTADRGTLFESGHELIERIRDAIVLRRPVLVTGPRGSGKSYCARRAIELAIEAGQVGGMRFLQGNREIPREYLSEDMLVVRAHEGRPELTAVDALAIRHPRMTEVELRERRSRSDPQWPALVDGRSTDWQDTDWTVLFLDEINRFGEGFLDSLLSLTEERTVVRAGQELHVPLTVVATANPPGYDVTAKKLSPPLQARMARAYRVAQPTLEAFSLTILPSLVARHRDRIASGVTARDLRLRSPEAPPELIKVCAGIGLCLWGTPSDARKGTGFLTRSTIELLTEAIRLSRALRSAMDELGELVAFGPDARSIGDWLGAALAAATSQGAERLSESHLLDTVLETLGHKMRETFNEGVEPQKAVRVGELIAVIAETVLSHASLRDLFAPRYEDAARAFFGQAPPAHEQYLFARRLSGLRFRSAVEQIAGVGGDDDVVKGLGTLAAAAAAHAIVGDLARHAVSMEAAAQAADAKARAAVGGEQAADAEARAAAAREQAAAAEMRAERARRLAGRLGSAPLDRHRLQSQMSERLALPPHVVSRISGALTSAGAVDITRAEVSVRFLEQALNRLEQPAEHWIARISPFVAELYTSAIAAFEKPTERTEIDWRAVGERFDAPWSAAALQSVASAMTVELRPSASKELWAWIAELARPKGG